MRTSKPPRPRHRGLRRQRRPTASRERGSVSLETVILIAPVIALLFGIVQGAVWYHARNVAARAAEDGVAAARVENASSSAGITAAMETVNHAGVIKGAQVAVNRTATTVTVTVTGKAPVILLDLGSFDITQTATGPRERITAPGAP